MNPNDETTMICWGSQAHPNLRARFQKELMMNQIILNAIHNCELLTFTYDGYRRVVEPHTYGMSTTGKESLRAYQVEGRHVSRHNQPWHLFTVSKIVGLSSAGTGFDGPRHDYKRNDSVMQHIYAQL